MDSPTFMTPKVKEHADRVASGRTCLLVLGMHRSGTSAITRSLSIAGAKLPTSLLGAGQGNEFGHWEPDALLHYHDRLLEQLGSSWHDWRALEMGRLPLSRHREIRAEIGELLKAEFGDAPLFVVKDPRICRFAPLFLGALDDAGIGPSIVHIVRNPLEVAESLKRRNGLAQTDAALLWLRHVLDSEAATRLHPRVIVSYEGLLKDWRATLERITEALRIAWPYSADDIAGQVAQFLDRAQRHHTRTTEDVLLDPETRDWVAEAYSALLVLVQNSASKAAMTTLDLIRREFNHAAPILHRLQADAGSAWEKRFVELKTEIAQANAALENRGAALSAREQEAVSLKAALDEAEALARQLKFHAEQQDAQVRRLEREIALLQQDHRSRQELIEHFRSSTSWKVTRPLRALNGLLVELGLARLARPKAARARGRDLGLAPPRTQQPETAAADPPVTIIVPNYNHAPFLQRRLKSVYGQTYPNTRVILLDDCSTDGSTSLLDEFARAYPHKTTTIYNSQNSGSPFHQWIKGIENAHGELIWIAESDDDCAADFLERMVPVFRDEAVLLAYGDINFINERHEIIPGLSHYLTQTGFDQWGHSYVRTAWQEFNGAFGVKNVIANVSGALLRRPTLDATLKQKLVDYRICGDWLFYMNVARGGKIAHVAEAKAFFRQHSANSSGVLARGESYYREHEDIALELRRTYGACDPIIEAQHRCVAETFAANAGVHNNRFALDEQYSLAKVLATKREKLRVLIASLGFFTGGGELLPIWLANALNAAGHAVTFFALGYEAPQSAGVRAMLNPGIAVLSRTDASASLADFDFDVISTHNVGLEYFFREWGAPAPVPYVVTHHGSYEACGIPDNDLCDFDRFVDRWVFIADKNLDLFKTSHCYRPEKFTKLMNGIPADGSPPADLRELGIGRDDFVCVVASRAIPEKGWRHAITSVKKANCHSGRSIALLLVGDGPVYQELQGEELDPHVKLLGFRPDVGALYAAGHCALLPSFFGGESFPLTLLESLQRGRPCIAPDIGEVKNIVTDGEGRMAGIVVPPKTTDARFEEDLAQAILRMANDKAFYDRSCSVARKLKDRYMIDEVARLYECIFRNEIERKRDKSAETGSDLS